MDSISPWGLKESDTTEQFSLPIWCSSKESACQCRRYKRCKFNPWVGKIPWSRNKQLTSVFLPGNFHGQRSSLDHSPWGHKKSDTAEWLSTYVHTGGTQTSASSQFPSSGDFCCFWPCWAPFDESPGPALHLLLWKLLFQSRLTFESHSQCSSPLRLWLSVSPGAPAQVPFTNYPFMVRDVTPRQHRHTLTRTRCFILFPSSSSWLSSSSWPVIFLYMWRYIFIHFTRPREQPGRDSISPSHNSTSHQASYVLMPSLKCPSPPPLSHPLSTSFSPPSLPTHPPRSLGSGIFLSFGLFHNPNDWSLYFQLLPTPSSPGTLLPSQN